MPATPVRTPLLWPFKRTYYGWAIVLVGAVSGFASAAMFGPVLAIFVKPIGDELGWSRATISIAFSCGTFVGSFASAAMGSFIDRHGTRVVTVVTGLVIAGAMAGIAGMTEPWHYWLFIGLGRGGATAGIMFANSVNVAKWFVRQRGRAQAIASTGLRVGQVALPLLIYAVMSVSSWRTSFLVMSVIVVLLIVIPGWIFVRSRPEVMGLLPDGAAPRPTPAKGEPALPPTLADLEQQWTVRQAARTRAFWLLIVAISGTFFINGAVNLHAVAHFQDQGMDPALAVTITTVFAVTTVFAAMAWGFVAERFHVRWATVGTASSYFLAMVVIITADSYPAALLFGLLFGVASGGWTTVERLIIPDYFGRRSAGAIGGLKEMAVGLLSPAGPILAGLVRDITGSYVPVFFAFAGVAVLVATAMVLARPPRHREPQGQPPAPVGV